MSDLDRFMHISLWVYIAHSSFIKGSLTTKNTACDLIHNSSLAHLPMAKNLSSCTTKKSSKEFVRKYGQAGNELYVI